VLCSGIRTTLRIHANPSIKIECGVPVGQCVPRQVAPPEPRGKINSVVLQTGGSAGAMRVLSYCRRIENAPYAIMSSEANNFPRLFGPRVAVLGSSYSGIIEKYSLCDYV
jgi:hypothetical protein